MTDLLALGIDIGTSGVRCAVLAPGGDAIALTAASMEEVGTDLRAPLIWQGALEIALDRLLHEISADRIGALAIDGTSGTVLAVDGSGAPIGRAYMYNDPVEGDEIVAAIANVAPRESAGQGANSGLARAIALQSLPGVTKILHQADWIAGLLSNASLGSDESNSLKTGYDPIARCWPCWLAGTGLRVGLLPRVSPAGAVTGLTSGSFGLPPGIPIVAGVSDGCASFLATGAARPGDGVTALGTTLTIKLLSDRPIFAPEYGIYSHRIGDIWLAGGASNTGGDALAAHFTTDQIAALSAYINPGQTSGLDYYPLPRPGERFPINDLTMSPRLEPRPGDDVVFLHGLLEGIARIEALGYQRLAEMGAPELRSIRTVGGGAANTTWQAIREKTLKVPAASVQSDSAAAGVARLALAHLGLA